MDNLELIQKDVEDLIGLLTVVRNEATGIEEKRKAMEASEETYKQREKTITDTLIQQVQRSKQLDEQQVYIEKQAESVRLTLAKIENQRKELLNLTKEKEDILEMKKELEGRIKTLQEAEEALKAINLEREEMNSERELMQTQRNKEAERTALLDERERRIAEKEKRIEHIEDIVRV